MKRYASVIFLIAAMMCISCISVEVKYSDKIKNERIPAVLYVPELPDYGLEVDMEPVPGLVFEATFKKHILGVLSSMDKNKMREDLTLMTMEAYKDSKKIMLRTDNKSILAGVKIVHHPKSHLLRYASFDFSDINSKQDAKYVLVMHPAEWGYIASSKMTRPAGRYFSLTLVGSLYDSTTNEVLWRKTFSDEESYGLFGTHLGVTAEASHENYKKLVKSALAKFMREIEKK